MKIRTIAAAALTAAAGTLFAVVPATGADAFVNNCWRVFSSNGVNVRTAPGGGSVVGSYAYGTWIDAWGSECGLSRVSGSTYTACGETSNQWAVISHGGAKRYVIRSCIAG